MKTVLIIDDEIDIVNNIKAILNDENYNCATAKNSKDAISLIYNQQIDLIILDVWLDNSELDGIELLKLIRKNKDIPIIIISGHGNIDMAVKAMKNGANEFIEKPFTTERLLVSVSRTIELHEIKNENEVLKKQNIFDYSFIGNSSPIIRIKTLLKKIGPTSSRVMIYGDSGTGKDIVAKEIHMNSNFKNGPFIAINAALMEPSNLEKELFGLNINYIGYLEKAAGGTLFIDEVGEMPLQTQAKILRVLTDKKFKRTEDDSSIELNCRIICSSIKDLSSLVEEGSFRKDLFHRLNVVSIKLPNLVDRLEDLDELIDYFSRIFADENKQKNQDIKPLIRSKYPNYDWPGNVRELRNAVERHIILGDKDDDRFLNDDDDQKRLMEKNVISLPLKNARKLFEKNYLLSQITRFDGNISKTASFIGMERSALHRKLKQLGISEEEKS